MRVRFTLPLPLPLVAAVLFVCTALCTASALAAGKPPRADAAASPPVDVATRLKSGDPAKVQSGLDDVRMTGVGGASAVPVIVQLLEQGLPLALTQSAIDTLGDTQSPAATPILAVYARHRVLSLRKSAVQALAKTKGTEAVKALRAALSDPDATVRGAAATALGGLKAHDLLGDLFRALDRGVPEAAASIGELCVAQECETLAGKLGKLPFEVVTSGIDQVLFRPPPDVSDELKVKLVERVRDVGTAACNRFLKQVQGRLRAAGVSTKVKGAVDAAVMATNLSPGAHEEAQ
jgi:hypothetical protein